MLQPVNTEKAPSAVGPYSQAVKVDKMVFCSGQIAFDPKSMQLVNHSVEAEAQQVFKNLSEVVAASGGSLADAVKLTIYLIDMGDFDVVNQVMMQYFQPPYPARACIAVKALPKGARVEVDAVLVLA